MKWQNLGNRQEKFYLHFDKTIQIFKLFQGVSIMSWTTFIIRHWQVIRDFMLSLKSLVKVASNVAPFTTITIVLHIYSLYIPFEISITLKTRIYWNVFVMDRTYKMNKYKMPLTWYSWGFYSCFACLEKEGEDCIWALKVFTDILILEFNLQSLSLVGN